MSPHIEDCRRFLQVREQQRQAQLDLRFRQAWKDARSIIDLIKTRYRPKRISQFFENQPAAEKWHQDLLRKMALRIEGIRDPVISDDTEALLSELLRFRHFKRYYFEFEYDWDKIDFLRKKFEQLRTMVESDLDRFTQFLRNLAE